MTDWYRHTEWTPAIADEFESRLVRSRSQKAQYLSLQGMALIQKHADAAVDLLLRAVALDDPYETVRALATLARARLSLGDVTGALEAYESALERQLAQPNIVAAQPADYLFVIGYFRVEDRLPAALAIAEAMPDEAMFGLDPQILAAKAMVFDFAGKTVEAADAAARALPLMEAFEDTAALGVDIGDLRRRLQALAGRAD